MLKSLVHHLPNLPVKLLPYSAADLAESVRNMFIGQAQEHGMSIRLVLSHEAQKIRVGDQTRVRQALSNLLRNALIHSKGTEVILVFNARSSDNGPTSVWAVIDNGVGILDSEVDRLFQPFERGNVDPRSHADGSGLGLTIVQTIAAPVLRHQRQRITDVEHPGEVFRPLQVTRHPVQIRGSST